MSPLMYAAGWILVITALAAALAALHVLIHSRVPRDHGPACWWCHPHLLPRRRG
ncbi:hypothetical protein [Streptomyces sp. NPDC008125]|uniref:hypothetical protein n=1 Tax=Streptomyces sp. NPDC008125 TaxID=3364811 RepID=UPI0036EB7D58